MTVLAARHQRLEQASRLDAQRLRRLHADAFGVGVVIVLVQREGDPDLFQRQRRGCGFGHQLLRPR
jgi:hypothetical protein